MNWQIPLSDLDLGPAEEAAVLRVLRSGWLTMGEETEAFEQAFAQFLGVRHALAGSSGTAALHLALLALGIGPGAAVIQPAVNFVAAANMTVACGATPLFAEICALDEPTLDPDSVEALLDAAARRGQGPLAVVVMHYGGYPCRMARILALCRERGVAVIEDACHGLGGRGLDERGAARSLGALGDVGCFSFFSNKNMTTGEGGMVVTDRDDLAAALRALRSHGMTTLTWDRHRGHAATYDVTRHGFNYRIDEVRSALGRVQLEGLPARNAQRRVLTQAYWRELAALEACGWVLPFKQGYAAAVDLEASACHLLTVVAPDAQTRWRAAAALREAGIQTSLHYPLVPGFSGFAGRESDALADVPCAAAFCARTLTLPLYPRLDEARLMDVVRTLRRGVES